MTNALGETVVYADYSYLSTVAECPRRAYYAYELGLEPKEPSVYLHAGRVLHAALHFLYTHDFDLEGALEIARTTWGSFRGPPDHHLTLGHCEIILKNYVEDRQHDAILPLALQSEDLNHEAIESFAPKIDEKGVVHFAETPLAAWLDEELVYAGLIDLPATIHGPLYVVDHKTTGQWLTERWARQYARSFQMKGYVALLQAVTGLKVSGVYINGVYTGKEAADPKEKWGKRSSVRSGLFGPFLFSDAALEEHRAWAKETARLVDYFRERQKVYEAEGRDPALAWPLNDKACDFCPFNQLCHSAPVMRPGLIRMHYQRRTISGILASGADSHE